MDLLVLLALVLAGVSLLLSGSAYIVAHRQRFLNETEKAALFCKPCLQGRHEACAKSECWCFKCDRASD